MNVFELFAKLSLDTSSYDEGLDNAEGKASSFGDKLKNGLGVAAGVTTAAITATTAATVAGAKAFIDGVSDVASYADHIDKLSQKMLMSSTSLQEWDFIMQHCGTSIESMQASIKTLSNAAETGNEAFEKLGMSQEEIASMSGEELFSATISALQNVEDETERTYLAGQLLGRGATELGALLNMSAEETEEMRQQVHDLGGVLSDEAVKSGAQFQDSLQNMQTAFTGMKNSMLTNFLPAFSTVMDGLSLVFSGDSNKGLGMIEEGVKNLASKIAEIAPVFIRVGGTILTSLATSIAQNAPLLIESGADAIFALVEGLIDNADMIFEAAEKVISVFVDKLVDPEKAAKFTQTAIDLIVKLANGISEALPVLLPAIMSVIAEIIRTLTNSENLKALINCALQLIMALAVGIVDAIPEIVKIIPEVIVNIVMALIESFPLIVETLFELIGALGMSIFNLIGGLLGMDAEEIQNSLLSVFNDLSAWGKSVGEWITNSLNSVKQKFTSIFDNVKNIVKNAVEFLKGLFKFDWKLPDIKLPHFTVSGEFNLDPANFSIPKIGVEWYQKAMNEPYMLSSATIFGAAGGKLLGGGESGNEIVYGRDQLMADIAAVIDARMNNLEFVVPVYIGEKKIDQQIVTSNARNAVKSGGR